MNIARSHALIPFLLLTFHFSLLTLPASAQAPLQIHYQGRVVDGTNLVNGTIGIRFRIFDQPVGGFIVYEGTNTATVVDGLYTTTIGEFSTSGTLLGGLGLLGGDGSQRWLEVAINGDALSPREPLYSVPFSAATYGLWPYNNGSFMLGLRSTSHGVVGDAENAMVIGGRHNLVASTNAAIVAGQENRIDTWSEGSVVLGGYGNEIGLSAPHNAIVGGYSNRIASNTRASSISGGEQNVIDVGLRHASIGGGVGNVVSANAATIGGGTNNMASGYASVVGGGRTNRALGLYAVVGGGWDNQAGASYSVVAGGMGHIVSPPAGYATIAGGFANRVTAPDAAVGGGYNNVASGNASTIPGGSDNETAGSASFAAGRSARAMHDGSFVWDSAASAFSSTATNQFLVRASGGVGINTNNPQAALHVAGSAMIGDNPEPARFGIRKIRRNTDGHIFPHPGIDVTLYWAAGSRILSITNNTGTFIQVAIHQAADSPADSYSRSFDLPNLAGTSVTNSAFGLAIGWRISVGSDAFPEGFSVDLTSFGMHVTGIATYWD